MQKPSKISRFFFKIIKFFVKSVYPKFEITGKENLSDCGEIIVGNHSQMHGPLCAEFYIPKNNKTWCAHQMMELKEVPAYTYQDFWGKKPKWIKWIFKPISYIIAPISVCIFKNAHTIPVYHDARIITTFKETLESLSQNEAVVIYPECYEEHNNIINEFQEKFVDIARFYYRKTKKELKFTPMYICPQLRQIHFGKPITFNPQNDINEERKRICSHLMDEITAMATELPRHKVVPYANVSKKEYKFNK